MNKIISEILSEANKSLKPAEHFKNIHRFISYCENILGRNDKDLVELRNLLAKVRL